MERARQVANGLGTVGPGPVQVAKAQSRVAGGVLTAVYVTCACQRFCRCGRMEEKNQTFNNRWIVNLNQLPFWQQDFPGGLAVRVPLVYPNNAQMVIMSNLLAAHTPTPCMD